MHQGYVKRLDRHSGGRRLGGRCGHGSRGKLNRRHDHLIPALSAARYWPWRRFSWAAADGTVFVEQTRPQN